jgi:hypothetical protein
MHPAPQQQQQQQLRHRLIQILRPLLLIPALLT